MRKLIAAEYLSLDGKNILIYGSRELVNALLQHKLTDVYRIMLYPVALGTGKRFFGDGGKKLFAVISRATNQISLPKGALVPLTAGARE